MLKKTILVIILVSFLFSFVSCDNYYIHPDIVREKFSTLTPKNQAGISGIDVFYIENQSFAYDYLISHIQCEEKIQICRVVVENSKIYTLAHYQKSEVEHHFYVIELDYLNKGTPITVFEKDVVFESKSQGYRYSNGVFIITNYVGIIDTKTHYYFYVIETGEFIQNTLENQFEEKYNISHNKRSFEITDKSTGVSKVVNSETVANSGYDNIFDGMYYYPGTYYQSGDTIVLAYRIKASTNHGFNIMEDGYFYACFTYDFETETLEFDSLLYPNDAEGVNLSYNTKRK